MTSSSALVPSTAPEGPGADRTAEVARNTAETRIRVRVNLDGTGAARLSSGIGFIVLMLITSGAAHLPPIKVVTILSGVIGVNLLLFIALAIVARGGRFLLLAWLLRKYGEPIREFIERRLGMLAAAAAAILILLYFAARYAL